MSPRWLSIDGSHGEGGGQILRSATTLAAITGRPILLERIRAGRERPGLAAQHLTAVRAVGRLVEARVSGAELGSQELRFEPTVPPRAGRYRFDVAEARAGGSAGSATLVLQAVCLPLALAPGPSEIVIAGGTHVPASPPFDHLRDAWLPALERFFGLSLEVELVRPGWMPVGGGELRARVPGAGPDPARLAEPFAPGERGALRAVRGRALASRLPAHVPQRMVARALSLLRGAGLPAELRAELASAQSSGAGLFLAAEYEHVTAGFSALGRRGKSSEAVAEEAVASLLAHHRSGAALDRHLGDQLVLPAALLAERSEFTVESVTRHLATCAWLVERFGLARVEVTAAEGEPGRIRLGPADHPVTPGATTSPS